jgi:hypothetical protein
MHEKLVREFQVLTEENLTDHIADCQNLVRLLANVDLDADELHKLHRDQQGENKIIGKNFRLRSNHCLTIRSN